jgi:hypothetical protein
MGETEVGGEAVIRNTSSGESFGSKGKGVSDAKSSNVARALAWCVAKDATNLLILKVTGS